VLVLVSCRGVRGRGKSLTYFGAVGVFADAEELILMLDVMSH